VTGVRRGPVDPSAHPRDLVAEAVRDYGVHAVVDTSTALLEGYDRYDMLPVPLSYLGGAHAAAELRRGDLVERRQDYWPRVWGARALRYVWLDYAERPLVAALRDPAWRVQEMAAKVTALRELGSAAELLPPLVGSPVPRVRIAAIRALGVVGEYEDLETLRGVSDPDPAVQVALDAALRRLRLRLDRPV
jgi:hypothetical protein